MPDSVRVAEELLADARLRTDIRLESCASRFADALGGRDGEALAYALRSSGKRVRPALVYAAYDTLGGILPGIAGVAAAVEIVHTYSLVHDDLPCMDDDDQRRGRPTTHVQFDVAVATRVGYLLVPVAIETLSQATEELDAESATLGRMATELLEASGIRGMVGGQWLDLEAEGRQVDRAALLAIHAAKTGALIRASCLLGGIAAGGAAAELEALSAFGERVGLAFQIADDVLDATSTSDQLGKTAGRDAALAKSTSVTILGVPGAMREAGRLVEEAIAFLARADLASASLVALARYIVTRTS